MAKGPCGGVGTAERLNQVCFCITLDRLELLRALDTEVGSLGFAAELATSHPSLLSNVPVFVTPETMIALTQVVAAVEEAARLPDRWRDPLRKAVTFTASAISLQPTSSTQSARERTSRGCGSACQNSSGN